MATGLLALVALIGAGCGESDPGALSATGVDGLSTDGQKQEYTDGVSRALQQLGSASGEGFSRAVTNGSKGQLRTAALAWRQGSEQLKSLDPPKDVVDANQALIHAVDDLAAWNDRIVAAAPNKAKTRSLAKQAGTSAASEAYGTAICAVVDAGYDVIQDANACAPLSDSGASADPSGDANTADPLG